MTPSPVVKNIILIGFMGSGKSSVARVIAPRLDFKFVDTDQLVVNQTGSQITAIFQNQGEEYFRDQETAALASLGGSERLVVATGGGIVLRERNVTLLREIGFVVWLTAGEETIFERVSRNQKRPLLHTPNPRETIHALLAARIPLYESAAHCIISTDGRAHEEIASDVILQAQRAD